MLETTYSERAQRVHRSGMISSFDSLHINYMLEAYRDGVVHFHKTKGNAKRNSDQFLARMVLLSLRNHWMTVG